MAYVFRPFCPRFGSRVDISTTSSASAQTLIASQVTLPVQIRIVNRGTDYGAYKISHVSTASGANWTTDPTLPSGAVEVITMPVRGDTNGVTDIYVSTIAGSSIGNMEFTLGHGV
jgi:hypothetical protein